MTMVYPDSCGRRRLLSTNPQDVDTGDHFGSSTGCPDERMFENPIILCLTGTLHEDSYHSEYACQVLSATVYTVTLHPDNGLMKYV